MCPANQTCFNGRCGHINGAVVYIGSDYSTVSVSDLGSPATALTSAVSLVRKNPIKILSYERYAQAASIAEVNSLLPGPQYAVTHTKVDSFVHDNLVFSSYSILLVHDQAAAPPGALATLGAYWSPALLTFVASGGIVVMLDGGTSSTDAGAGTGEMPDFSTATTLLNVTSHADVAPDTSLDLNAPGDAVGSGLFWPYGSDANSVSLTTEAPSATVVYVVTVDQDGSAGPPVIVHKTF
jgi:hypothetical protein